MNKRYLFLLILFMYVTSKAEKPFLFEANYTGEGVANFTGGIKSGTAYLGMANIYITFDTEKSNLWKGGTFFINMANTHGCSPSATMIGDYQVESNIEAGNHSFLQEFWYQQKIKSLSLTIGLQDMNVELANTENGTVYRNSSFGIMPVISSDVSVPIFPLTALGVTLGWDITEETRWISAVYDGVITDFDKNPYNVDWNLRKKDGALFVSEVQQDIQLSDKLSGTLKLGGYYHTHKLEDDDSGKSSSNYGIYAIADQTIIKTSELKKTSVFIQSGYNPNKYVENSFYLGGGINQYGIGQRKNDILGLAFAHAAFTTAGLKPETVFELTYKTVFTDYFYLQPDIQYVIHPAGTGVNLKNAFTAAIRFGLNISRE